MIHVKAEEDIKNGQAVYASGASGIGSGNITVRLYRAGAGDIEELYFIGVATQDIATNEFGFVSTFGKVRGVQVADTRASDDPQALSANNEGWDIGTILYISPAEAGKYTQTKPVAPDKDIPVVMIISENGDQRTFFTRYEHGYHLSEIHDVLYNKPLADGDLLTWNGSISAWENQPETDPVFSSWAQSVSSNYESTYTTVNINSADWTYVAANSASGSNVSGLSSNWENTYTTVNTNSADWANHFNPTDIISTSGNWDSSYTTVNTNSADWAYVAANSGTGGSGGSDVSDLSGNWENTYNTVQSNSADWNSTSGLSLSALNYKKWSFSANGVTATFSITGAVSDVEEAYQVTVNNVLQNSSSYTIDLLNEEIDFTASPPASAEVVVIETQVELGRRGGFGISVDGEGSAVTTGVKGTPIRISDNCTIDSVEMVADVSGVAVVDIWANSYANYPPTSADSIVGSNAPTLTAATGPGAIKSQDDTLTGWTTSLNRGDYIIFNVDEAATLTKLTLTINVIYN